MTLDELGAAMQDAGIVSLRITRPAGWKQWAVTAHCVGGGSGASTNADLGAAIRRAVELAAAEPADL